MTATILVTGATGLIGFRILLAVLGEGHNVRYTARSEEKAQVVLSNPAVQQLQPGQRLMPVVISDLTADGAFDGALQGVTYVIHAGSPVPVLTYELITIIITSLIVVNMGLVPSSTTVSAETRVPLLSPVPDTFDNVFAAYVMGKMVEMHNSDELVRTQNPHFTVSHVVPGYVFGRNELALDSAMMQAQNSSNNFRMMGLLGGELPMPIHGGMAHIDDVADAHMRVLFLDPSADGPQDFGVSTKVDYSTIFDHVGKAFPEVVSDGIFKRGVVPTLPVEYDSSETEKLLGGKLRGFEDAVVEVASQYLQTLGKEKA